MAGTDAEAPVASAVAASFFDANVLANLLVDPGANGVTAVVEARGPVIVGDTLKGGSIFELSHLPPPRINGRGSKALRSSPA